MNNDHINADNKIIVIDVIALQKPSEVYAISIIPTSEKENLVCKIGCREFKLLK